MAIHLGRRSPGGSSGRPEGWAAHLSPRRTGVAPSYLALLRVEFAPFHSARTDTWPVRTASSLWHWSSPFGGRALPATLRWRARTFLEPRRPKPRAARGHPIASLTRPFYGELGALSTTESTIRSIRLSGRAGPRRASGHPRGRDRWRCCRARPRRGSGPVARARRTTARSPSGAVAPRREGARGWGS